MAVTYLDGPVMAMATFDPYVSEFEFASRFHPSNNPDCMKRWSSNSDEDNEEFKGADFEYRRYHRSPEEGSPVGQEPSIEVRAILVRCPKNEQETDDILINRNIYNITAARSQDILDFHGFDSDEPEHHSEVRDCRRKLIITMKFNNIGRTKTQEEFVVIDHVLDPVTMQKSRLLNPFVVKVRQEPVLQLYGLKFQGVVNAQAREEVINKNMSNYTGCDDGPENPTCGQMIFEEKPVPYSQGFCCSCASELNIQRQSSLLNESFIPPFPSYFPRSKISSIRPSKSSRSLNKNFLHDHPDLEETSQDEELFENSKDPNFDHDEVSSKDQNITFTKNSDDEEVALKNLKNLSRMTEQNEKSLDARKLQGSVISVNEKTMKNNHMAPFHHSDRINFAAELKRLEEDYKNLRMSNLIRAEAKNSGLMVKDSNEVENNIGAKNVVAIGRIPDKVATEIDKDLQEQIPTSSYGEKMPFPSRGQSNDRIVTMGIDILFAIKPKQKSTTCPFDPAMESLTTCPMERLTSQSLEKTESPAVLKQTVVNARIYSSRTEHPSYINDEGQEIADSSSLEATTDLSRKFSGNSGEPLTNVAISGDAKDPRSNHGNIDKSRHQKMNNATSTGNSTTTLPDTQTESRITSQGTTENLQHTFDPTQSFDNLSTQVESSGNLSSSFSSGNHSEDQPILLSGSLQNQLANWFSYDKGKKFGRRRKGKKSRKNVGRNSEIGHGSEVEFFGMKIPTMAADDLKNGHHEVEMTTILGIRRPVEIYLKTDNSFDRRNKKKTFLKNPDPEEVNVSIPKKSEPLKIPRSHSSIDDESAWNKNTDEQKSVDKEIEDEFADISETLKNVGFFGMKIPTTAADDLKNGHHEVEMTTILGIRRPVEIYLKTDDSFDRHNQKKTFLKNPDPEEVNVSIPEKSEPLNISRSHRSIDDESAWNKNTDQQKSIDKEIEDEFANISEALKNAADYPTLKKDHSVIEKIDLIVNDVSGRKSIEENDLPIHSIEVPAAVKEEIEVEMLKPTGELVSPGISETTRHEMLVDKSIPQKIGSSKNLRHDIAKDSNKAENTKIRNLSPPFDDKAMRESGSTENLKNQGNEIKSEIGKKTEVSNEPVSELPLTTGPQIIVDRFKIVRPFVDSPKNYEELLKKSMQNNPTNLTPKIRNLEENERRDTTLFSTSFHTTNRNTESVFGNIVTTPKIVEEFPTTLQTTAIFDRTSSGKNNTSLHGVMSPVFMIENLKKELRKEAERYAVSPSPLRGASVNSRGVQGHQNFVQEVREVNTELTPAEKAEDLVTDEETLPPDEETRFTTKSLAKTTIMTTSVTSSAINDLENMNYTLIPGRFLQGDEIHLRNQKHAVPENLKKELRKEAERYAVSSSPLQGASVNSRGVQGHQNFVHEVREVNTELTPAEKAEDLVTDEETLPPEEETVFTTKSLAKTTIMTTSVTSSAINDLENMNYTLIPGRFLQDDEIQLENQNHAEPKNLKKELRKEVKGYALSSSPLQGAPVNFRGVQGHQNFVQELREVNTELTPAEKAEDLVTDEETLPPEEETRFTTKSLAKTTIMTTEVTSSATNDLENMNYTLIPARFLRDDEKHAVPLKRIENTLMVLEKPSQSPSSSLRLGSKKAHKKRNRFRRHHLHGISRHKKRSSTEYPNRVKSRSKSGKVIFSRKRESDQHAKLAGFKVKEKSKSEITVDPNVPQVPKVRNVDEMPIFQRTGLSTLCDESNGKSSTIKVKTFRNMRKSEGVKKNIQAHSTPKFRSIYPKSDEIDSFSERVVDEVTGDIPNQNKRDDLKTFDETDPEALIFYDYDANNSPPANIPEDVGNESKRSLENLENEKSDDFRSRSKSALHPLKKRSNSVSHDEDIAAKSSALLSKKIPTSINMSDDQFRIEPSEGWKAKMELLKLKKHADVLKEYLNWRHDIVRPEPIGISGYTTKISMTTEKDERFHSETITTQQFNVTNETTLKSTMVTSFSIPENISVTNQPHEDLITTINSNNDDHVTKETSMAQQVDLSNETTLKSTNVTSSSVPEDISITLQPHEDLITTMTSNDEDHVTGKTSVSSFSESSSTSSTTNFLGNFSLTETNVHEVEASPGYLHTESQENSSDDKEKSTGRILPPCCPTLKNIVTTCPADQQKNVDRLSSHPYLSEVPNFLSKTVPDHPSKLGDLENDLLIISVMEKNRVNNKNVAKSKQHHKSSSKIYRIRKEDDPVSALHHRHHKSKKKIQHSTSGKKNDSIRRARRLMSIEDLDYEIDDEEGDRMFDNYEVDVNEESPVSGILDAFHHDHNTEKLENKWERLIDKIIHTNSSEYWVPENSTEASLPEEPGDNKSALKQLHFKNADKYIREMARKIVHNSNIRITNLDLDKNADKNRAGRKLQNYPRLGRRKTVSNIRKKNAEYCGNFADTVSDKRSGNNDRKKFPHLSKKSAYIRKFRSVDDGPEDRPTKYRDGRSFGFEGSQYLEDIPEESDSEDNPESSFTDDNDFEPEEADDSQLQLLEQKNLDPRHSSADSDRNHDDHNEYIPDIKVLKVIPLDSPSPGSKANNWPEYGEKNTKVNRMTASQLPKMENDHIPEETLKPEKIKPAELPQENDPKDDKNLVQNIDASQQESRAAQSSSNNEEQNDINARNNPSSNLDVSSENVPLIHVQIEHQPSDKENPEGNYVPPGNPDDLCPFPDINDGADKKEDNDNRDQDEVVTMNMDNDEELREPSGIGSCPESNQQAGPIISSSPDDDKLDQIRPTEKPSGNQQGFIISSTTTCEGESDRLCERERIRLKNILAIMEFIEKIKDVIGEEGTHMANTAEDRNKEILFISSNVKSQPVKQNDSGDLKYQDFPKMDSRHVMKHSDEMLEGTKSHKDPEDVQERNTELPMNLQSEIDKSVTNKSANDSVVVPKNLTNDHHVPEEKSPQEGNEKTQREILENLQRKIDDRLGLNDNLAGNKSQDLKTSLKKERSVDFDFSSLPKIKRDRLRLKRMQLRDPRRKICRGRSLPNTGEVSRIGNVNSRKKISGKGISKRKRKKKKKKKKRRKKKKHKKKKTKHLRDAEIKGKSWWPFGRQLMSLADERELTSDQNLDRDVFTLERRKSRRVHRAKYPHGKKKKMKKRRKHKKVKKKKRRKKKKKGKGTKKMGLRSKRQINPGGNQVRGGQDCMDRKHPPNVDPAKYLESAHCLRFSDLWYEYMEITSIQTGAEPRPLRSGRYSVYELENPIMEHTVYLQLFEKHNRADGTTHWEDLTQGSMVRMGTFTRHQRDSTPTIVFTYSGAKIEPQNRALNLEPSRERLLIPSPVPPKKASDYPAIRGGSGEYLVVPTAAISKDGNECDKAGVGFAAFSKQQDRCDRPKGSCLKNQPLDYWAHDMEARESGRPGCYFLSNFASVPSEPIKYNVSGSGSREYLGLEYHSTHVSAIDIQVRSDYNAIVRVGSSGRVTEVYVDSTALEHTVVTVVISNMGLASSPYQPRITDCPSGLPVSWTKAKGIMQVIPPQHDQRVTLDLYGQLLLNEFHCSVEVVNHQGELVAMRRIRVQRMDRCFCVWHCLCACVGSVSGMGCTPMSPEHYHAAGFQGPVPVVTTETSVLMNAVKNVLTLSALFVLLLLFLGILKWVIGMFASTVGRWGLDSLLEGSRIEEYLEPELKCRCVMTDNDGWPVHPDTGQRTVRICSRKLEFFLNLVFFLTYPIAVCCNYCRRSLKSSRQRNCCPDESKMCLINEKGGCPKMICVSTYGDNRNTKLEAEDTKYVMNELKKSQESLQNPKRSKKKIGHKNSKDLSYKSKSGTDLNAKKFVHDLLSSRVVFRNLTEPIGGLRIPFGTTYSLRGYFLNAEDGGYRFITPCPFKQHWLIEKNQKVASEKPPETYASNLFMRSFGTARHVYESGELSLNPKGICINVQYQEET